MRIFGEWIVNRGVKQRPEVRLSIRCDSAGGLVMFFANAASRAVLDADGKWLGMRGGGNAAAKPPLQQGHQSGVPISHDEKQQEWNRNIVLVIDGVVHGECEIRTDQQLDP